MKRIRASKLKIIAVVMMLLFVSPVIICLGSHLVAQIALWQVGTRLFDYPLPPQTEILERNVEYMNGGGSSACVGHVSLVVATALSEAELHDYYYADGVFEQTHVPILSVSIEGQLPDGRWRAVIDSYGAIDGRDYSLLC